MTCITAPACPSPLFTSACQQLSLELEGLVAAQPGGRPEASAESEMSSRPKSTRGGDSKRSGEPAPPRSRSNSPPGGDDRRLWAGGRGRRSAAAGPAPGRSVPSPDGGGSKACQPDHREGAASASDRSSQWTLWTDVVKNKSKRPSWSSKSGSRGEANDHGCGATATSSAWGSAGEWSVTPPTLTPEPKA